MSIFQREPDYDRTYGAAVHDARQDFDRLAHMHLVNWTIDPVGTVKFTCTCSPTTPRNAAALDAHIREIVKRERGPLRK